MVSCWHTIFLFQIRLTSPEHQVRAHAYEDELGGGGGLHDRNGKDSPERGFGNGGGFFSKRFGITKMKVKIYFSLPFSKYIPKAEFFTLIIKG